MRLARPRGAAGGGRRTLRPLRAAPADAAPLFEWLALSTLPASPALTLAGEGGLRRLVAARDLEAGSVALSVPFPLLFMDPVRPARVGAAIARVRRLTCVHPVALRDRFPCGRDHGGSWHLGRAHGITASARSGGGGGRRIGRGRLEGGCAAGREGAGAVAGGAARAQCCAVAAGGVQHSGGCAVAGARGGAGDAADGAGLPGRVAGRSWAGSKRRAVLTRASALHC